MVVFISPFHRQAGSHYGLILPGEMIVGEIIVGKTPLYMNIFRLNWHLNNEFAYTRSLSHYDHMRFTCHRSVNASASQIIFI